jgi:hypothetical protein
VAVSEESGQFRESVVLGTYPTLFGSSLACVMERERDHFSLSQKEYEKKSRAEGGKHRETG